MKLPEFIKIWVSQNFASHDIDQITNDLIDVMAGNRNGNRFERKAACVIHKLYTGKYVCEKIAPGYYKVVNFFITKKRSSWLITNSDGKFISKATSLKEAKEICRQLLDGK